MRSLFFFTPLVLIASLFLPGRAFGHSECEWAILRPDEVQRRHESYTHDLYQGKVESLQPFSQDNNKHSLFILKVRRSDGTLLDVFFKPRTYGDEDGWARAPMEYVAYALNRTLEMDYVPPTSYRRGLHLGWHGQHFTEGAFILKIENFKPLANLPGESFGTAHEAVISDHRILAVLLQNQDGHHMNLGHGKPWASEGTVQAAFIDWGAALRHGAQVTMTDHEVYGNSAPVTKFRQRSLDALKNLHWHHLQPLIDAFFISESEAHGILMRRDGIVHYFEKLKAKNRANVLRD